MEKMRDPVKVSQQYKDNTHLAVRVMLHKKYSTNPYGYDNWLFDQYQFVPGCKILEVGAGDGRIWQNRLEKLPDSCQLTLTDLSEGMVQLLTNQFGQHPQVACRVMDIQAIPEPDDTYDAVIAHSMLYHVPSLHLALREAARVLKPGGRFYAATVGVHNGMTAYLRDALHAFDPAIDAFEASMISFSLENGAEILSAFFANVEQRRYEDALAVTDIADLIAWLKSTLTLSAMETVDFDRLADFFEQKKDAQGVLSIPKSAGLFVSVKA